MYRPPVLQLTSDEREVILALTRDLFVAPTEALSLPGMLSLGYRGDHELVVGGYSQASAGACPAWRRCCCWRRSSGRGLAEHCCLAHAPQLPHPPH